MGAIGKNCLNKRQRNTVSNSVIQKAIIRHMTLGQNVFISGYKGFFSYLGLGDKKGLTGHFRSFVFILRAYFFCFFFSILFNISRTNIRTSKFQKTNRLNISYFF